MDERLIPTQHAIQTRLPYPAKVVDVVEAAQTGMNVELTGLVVFDGGDIPEVFPIPFHSAPEQVPRLEQLIPVEVAASGEREQTIDASFHAEKADFPLRPLSGLELIVQTIRGVLLDVVLPLWVAHEGPLIRHGT
jgi:hypothetical protein